MTNGFYVALVFVVLIIMLTIGSIFKHKFEM